MIYMSYCLYYYHKMWKDLILDKPQNGNVYMTSICWLHHCEFIKQKPSLLTFEPFKMAFCSVLETIQMLQSQYIARDFYSETKKHGFNGIR